eukprot:TRINITY_DN2044_c0_g1_i1.p1 TRINITY_DN2044_c0_g1~~TRINITY_DN2044_c0_g1_i1.p1  ORF type:complete len:242 (-),score=61.95 TRINITY_DN2044_c0_g1_i1:4-705(-)
MSEVEFFDRFEDKDAEGDADTKNPHDAALLDAAIHGKLKEAQTAIRKGANVNMQSKQNTPLHWASYKGHAHVLELLLQKGANIDARGVKGQTALDDAVEKGHKAVVEVLLKHGADVFTVTNEGKRPADFAKAESHREIADMLAAQAEKQRRKEEEARQLKTQVTAAVEARKGQLDAAGKRLKSAKYFCPRCAAVFPSWKEALQHFSSAGHTPEVSLKERRRRCLIANLVGDAK